jgi:hypothetical protein
MMIPHLRIEVPDNNGGADVARRVIFVAKDGAETDISDCCVDVSIDSLRTEPLIASAKVLARIRTYTAEKAGSDDLGPDDGPEREQPTDGAGDVGR